ncbi:hypothetical protein N802_17245 [Knoellia sinensis KCTC 19936]|uniref:DNA-binding protein (MmcQ/YjbR family) n=1 Tax=Knoellia sinensis KCTC 19936 TaxID=1385520 RepID=A0A0A0JAE3_9MICO|nr:MmcQ/YjbR family DNA-binding protein [Knoellia sinensis]KGN32551.1 hypothetical protein N802_17245 [Knoellia sinensis KCTC 19936]
MTPEEVAAYALAKPGAWADQPWEGDHVAKVGDKIFAFLGGLGSGESAAVGVKLGTRAEADEWIAEFPDHAAVSAYIGRHGWNTLVVGGAIPDDALREAIDTSYELVVAKLPRSQRPE